MRTSDATDLFLRVVNLDHFYYFNKFILKKTQLKNERFQPSLVFVQREFFKCPSKSLNSYHEVNLFFLDQLWTVGVD